MVEFIKYKDQDLPISINFGILLEMNNSGLDVDSKDGKETYEALKHLFWLSLEEGHFHENKKLEIKKEHIKFYFNYCFDEFKKKLDVFTASREEFQGGKPKKLTVKERLKSSPKNKKA